MRIYRMTATFGKLDHAVLELKPGLNVITAPNEWGKSTWCAFLAAMFYGLDTRAKSTKNTLADKERYAPWSGVPMEGRIDLNWNGRDITIERRTKRRVPLGDFRAYETASGVPVEELTAANCGAMLLGVEQSVYRRAGFIRHTDLPVTQDEALRRRLNALVTTGDDSGGAERLAASLKELKNRCRYNRSGLLPQAEAQREELEAKLRELEELELRSRQMYGQLEDIKVWLKQLYNHQQTLAYQKMQQDIARVAQARAAMEAAEQEQQSREALCAPLPPQEETRRKVRELRAFREQWNAIQAEQQAAPREPELPEMEAPYTGMTAEQAREMAKKDAKTYTAITAGKAPGFLVWIGIFGILAAAGLAVLRAYLYAAVAGAAGVLALGWGIWEKRSMKRQARDLVEKYGDADWKRWIIPIAAYEERLRDYRQDKKAYQEVADDLEVRLMVLRKKRETLCGSQDPEQLLETWQEVQENWDALILARREAAQTKAHFEALNAMVKPAEKPTMPDTLTMSEAETNRLQTECAAEQQRLQNRLGQYQGRMEILGDRDAMKRQLETVNRRIQRLEETYAALTIAQDTLAQARAELQSRFAPRITQKAQKLLADMTGGRYHSLTMREDFSLQAAAGEEITAHDALWRSDGTVDQLYLALRLAVAAELTPQAPLVLDDVLVRFDDERLGAALEILKELSEQKQIILFTCQGREAQWIS